MLDIDRGAPFPDALGPAGRLGAFAGPADPLVQWHEAARSLGLDEAAQPLLGDEAKAGLATQLRALMEAGEYAAARELAWLLAFEDPWDRDRALDLALCLQHQGDLASACRFYSTALLLDPTDAYCLYRIGECLQGLGEREDARAVYRAAVDQARADPACAEVAQHAERRLDELQDREVGR